MTTIELPPDERLTYELDLIEHAVLRDADGAITPEADLAISSLYSIHQPTAFQTIYRKVRQYQTAEDLSQDVMERILLRSLPEKERPQLVFPRGLGGFVRQSAYNSAIDYFRKNSHSTAKVGNEDAESYIEHLADSTGVDVERAVVDGSMALHELLKMLIENGVNRDFLTALLLTNEGYTCHEIAERQGIKPGTALSRIHRARKQVARIIRQGGMLELPSSVNFGLRLQKDPLSAQDNS